MHDKETLYSVFKAITELVHSDSGDGGGCVWCRHYNSEEIPKIADLYEKWFNEEYFPHWKWKWNREDKKEYTIFYYDQESIIFSKDDKSTIEFGDYLIRI